LAAYHRSAAKAIERFGGHVANYFGDGVMAYFGYPEAHENDAERAARAGLAILEAIAALTPHTSGPNLSARVGIDSGAVVVGAGARAEIDVFGETPNIAARLQTAAAPDTVVISAATYRLIAGLFLIEDRGAQTLKGVDQPTQLYRVIEPANVRGRLGAIAASRGLTPFVGRESELHLLTNRWQRALDGEGQVVLMLGEAGIGKSRLVQQFHDRITGTRHTWIEAAAAPFYQNTPFYPITEALWHLVWDQGLNRFGNYLRQLQSNQSRQDNGEIPTEELSGERLAQLQSRLLSAGLKPAEALPLIAPLMNLPLSATYTQSALSPDQQRRSLLATLIEWLLGAARAEPLAMVIEDLHWSDASTLELIQLMAEQGATAGLFLLITARPEFRAEWPLRAHHTQITLNRLSTRNVREMIAQVAAQNALADETLDTVVERTSGVPLFVEELTRAVLESGNLKLSDREIPATLHDSLMARLDRLGSAKEVLQIGSVIGSEFSYELLRAVHSLPDEDLQRQLRILSDADLLHVRGIAPEASYQFKHALIRDAAYEALLRSWRKELHSRIAEVLVEQFPERVTSAPELLAHHYTEAGLVGQAISHWQQAGQMAVDHSANVEAISHFTRALDLLKLLPPTPENAEVELALQISLAVPLASTKGWAAPEVRDVYARGQELCRQTGNSTHLVSVLYGLRTFYHIAGDFREARRLADELVALAETREDSYLFLARSALGSTLFCVGELTSARTQLEKGISIGTPGQYPSHMQLYSMDTGIILLGFLAWTLWFLGFPDQGRKRNQEDLVAAHGLAHPYSMAWALSYAAWFHMYSREALAAQQQAEAAIATATEYGFAQILAWGNIERGWALAESGKTAQGLQQIEQGLGSLQSIGAEAATSWVLALMAEARARIGEIERGLALLADAVQVIEKNDEHFYEAEVYRLKGQLTLQRFNPRDSKGGLEKKAEEYFRTAIQIARTQHAKSLELRAVVSLARLRRQQGKKEEARNRLAEIYGWFTEGFDTADLKEAKALLDELSE
jgi:tetratricopeptide (TPR) repeat protein